MSNNEEEHVIGLKTRIKTDLPGKWINNFLFKQVVAIIVTGNKQREQQQQQQAYLNVQAKSWQ